MRLTPKQNHVLTNLERIAPIPRKLTVTDRRERFSLDGWDCTQQVTSLIVRKEVRKLPCGTLARLPEARPFGRTTGA